MEQPKKSNENKDKMGLSINLDDLRSYIDDSKKRSEELRKKIEENKEKTFQDFLVRLSSGEHPSPTPALIEDRMATVEVEKAALEGIEKCFISGNTWIANEIMKQVTLEDEPVSEAKERGFIKYLKHQYSFSTSGNLSRSRDRYSKKPDNVFDVIESLNMSEERLNEIIYAEFITRLERGKVTDVSSLLETFDLSKKIYEDPGIQEKVPNFIISAISQDKIIYLDQFKRKLPLAEESLHSPESLEAAVNLLIRYLKPGGYFYNLERLIKEFPELINTFNERDIREAALEGIIYGFSKGGNSWESGSSFGYINEAEKVIGLLKLTKEELSDPKILEASRKVALGCLKKGLITQYKSIREQIPIPLEDFNSPEFNLAASEYVKKQALSCHDTEVLEVIKKDYPDTKKIFETDSQKMAIVDEMVNLLNGGSSIEYILVLKDRLVDPVPPESAQKISRAAKNKMLEYFRTGDVDLALSIHANFDIPKEDIQTKEAQALINKNIVAALGGGDFVAGIELSKLAGISDEEMRKTIKESVLKLISDGKIFAIRKNREGGHEFDEDRYDSDYGLRGIGNKKRKISQSAEELLEAIPEYKDIMNDAEVLQEVRELFVHFAKIGQIERIETMKQKLLIDDDTIMSAFKEVSEKGSGNRFKALLTLNSMTEKPIDPLLEKSAQIFGDFVSFENYKIIKDISEGNISGECKLFGVKVGGEAGINQLEQGFTKFKSKILEPDFDPKIILESSIAADFFRSFIRFDESEWGGEDQSPMHATIERYLELRDDGEYETYPLNPEFKESGIRHIDLIDKDAKPIEYSKAFLERFETISNDIRLAKYLCTAKFPITDLVKSINYQLIPLVEDLRSRMDAMEEGKGREALAARITKLEGMELRSLKNFESNFEQLAKLGDKNMNATLRQAMFLMGFSKNKTQLEKDLNKVDEKNPELNDITWTMNFVDHIVNKEVMGKYFKDKAARNEFKKLISTKSFEDELSRFRNQETKGKLPVKFIPSKGILLEFSGHIADACWADRYRHTIPATFPNFNAITMVQNPGTKHERLFGSAILIETREAVKDGKKLLLIRGLNPIQNTINQLSVEDFYKEFTNYIKELGQKTGREVAIVIDKHSGGSGTNRPMLFNYLESIKPNLKQIRVPYRETEFNGYDVTKNAYLVE